MNGSREARAPLVARVAAEAPGSRSDRISEQKRNEQPTPETRRLESSHRVRVAFIWNSNFGALMLPPNDHESARFAAARASSGARPQGAAHSPVRPLARSPVNR